MNEAVGKLADAPEPAGAGSAGFVKTAGCMIFACFTSPVPSDSDMPRARLLGMPPVRNESVPWGCGEREREGEVGPGNEVSEGNASAWAPPRAPRRIQPTARRSGREKREIADVSTHRSVKIIKILKSTKAKIYAQGRFFCQLVSIQPKGPKKKDLHVTFHLWCLTDFTSPPHTIPLTLWGIRAWSSYVLQPWDTMSLRTADLGSMCVRARSCFGLTQTPQQSHPLSPLREPLHGELNATR